MKQYKDFKILTGPCSAESEKQVMKTAEALCASGVPVAAFRAGIWKPRTKPGGFEGVGEPGLKWLRKVRETFLLPVATEVAQAAHVKAALEYDIDILWIGARSVANPFTVQEIAEALSGTEKKVYVKNPVSPDVALWAGAVERLRAQNIHNIGAIHRGFTSYGNSQYRNPPFWKLPLEFRDIFPETEMLIDPSHICGNRHGIRHILEMALQLQYDGMIIETHINPDEAWSDAKQQITPAELGNLLASITFPAANAENLPLEMEMLRNEISALDDEVVRLLAKRMSFAEKIGDIKRKQNLSIFQPERWKCVKSAILRSARDEGLDEAFTEQLIKLIHEESIRRQGNVSLKDSE